MFAKSTPQQKLGVTQELLSVVTGLAHYVKLMVRIGLKTALESEALEAFLDGIPSSDEIALWTEGKSATDFQALSGKSSDTCDICEKTVESACYMVAVGLFYHTKCISCPHCNNAGAYEISPDLSEQQNGRSLCRICSKPCESILIFIPMQKQYMFLLQVAFARFVNTCHLDWAEILEVNR